MGMSSPVYVNNLTGQCEVASAAQSVTVTDPAANFSFTSIVVPADISGTILHVYLDFVLGSIENTKATENYLKNAQYVQINNGSGWVNALLIPDRAFMTMRAASGYSWNVPAGSRIYGAVDIVSYATKGATIQIRWASALADGPTLIFHVCYPILRILTG
jgi:hypothetical protein